MNPSVGRPEPRQATFAVVAGPTIDLATTLATATGRPVSEWQSLYENWVKDRRHEDTFLDFLCRQGCLDRVAAHALWLTLQGKFDPRDLRELLAQPMLRKHWQPLLVAAATTHGPPIPAPASPPPPRELLPVGTQLGRYRIKGYVGGGGMGVVYLAMHPTLGVPVAIKVAVDSHGRSGAFEREQLRKEGHLLAAVLHPNVVRLWDCDDGDPMFLVYEFVAGQNLRDRLHDHGPLPLPLAFAVAVQTARGLRAAARVGVVHGDVKPANILLTPEQLVKVTDFGAGSLRGPSVLAPRDGSTAEPWVIGSLPYMAPERFEGRGDARSDQYSLGLTLYQLLSGQCPMADPDPNETLCRHKSYSPEPLHRVAPGVPKAVSDLVRRMIAKDPDDRYRDYEALISALEATFELKLDPM
jgi:hypothetical protein